MVFREYLSASESESLTINDSNSLTHYSVNMPCETTPHGRRRLNPETRKATIMKCAMERFSQSPYEQTSIAQIASDAEASVALVHKYFGTKAELYTATLDSTFAELLRRQQQADDPQQSARERVRIMLLVYIDLVAELPIEWAKIFVSPGAEPALATQTRMHYHQQEVTTIAELIGGIHWYRDEAALHGYLGFLQAATYAWLEAGRQKDHKHALIDATLGALQGALGDWRQ
ncbi:transcriptional regulator BetI [Corynebacterium freiburgense]|nr:transcriptional regulator BetI [Corynebacterium freiburgense]